MSKEIDLHILQYYQPTKLLGSGAYGHVWKVLQKQTKKTYALKKIFDAFQNSTDAQRTYRQISLLHQMQHANIIKLHKVIKAKNKKDLYLVFQYMQSDLHLLVGEDILNYEHIKFVVYQMLKALKYIHSAQLIHRDLKPSNILINSDCQVKLCDFGLARSLAHEENQQNILSEQVATRWYRSPQILLNSKDYSKPTDIWSVGCIIAQLLIGEPIFQGNSTLNQLQKIIQFTGMPSKYNIDSLKSECAQNIINSLSVRKKSLKDYFRKSSPQISQLISLMMRMLQFNPQKRPTVQELIIHPMFSQFEKSNNEEIQICQKFIVPQIDDNIKLTLQEYRAIIYKDIQRRYPQFNDSTRIKGIYSILSTKKNNSFVQKGRNKSLERSKNNSSNQNSHIGGNQSLKKQQKQLKQYKVTKSSSSLTKSQSKSQSKSKIKKSVSNKFSKNDNINTEYQIDQLKAKYFRPVVINHCQQEKQHVKMFNAIEQNANNDNKANLIKQSLPSMHYNSAYKHNCKPQMGQNNSKHKQQKQIRQKQNNASKIFVIPQVFEEKAVIYKNELKRMKSNKNLCKSKPLTKPKFQKTVNKLK